MTIAAEPTLTVTVGPRNAYTDKVSGLRFYRWQGRDLPSVTSIRRMAGIPHGLHQWSIGKVIERVLDDLPGITATLSSGTPTAIAAVKAYLRKASTEERDAAAKLGTAVHDAAAEGKTLTDVPKEVAPRLRQYLDWLAVSGAEILGSEFQCWNLGVGYAGTADLLCRFPDGSIWLVDLKTGKGVYADHATQLVAYLMSDFVGEDDVVDDRLTGFLKQARGMAILHLSDKDWEFIQVKADAEVWAAFRGLLAFGMWTKDHDDPVSFTVGRKVGQG